MSFTLTTMIATGGFVLSLVNVAWSIFRERRQVTVRLSRITNDHMDIVRIIVANPGRRPVSICQPYITFPDNIAMLPLKSQSKFDFPYLLTEGNQCSVEYDAKEISGWLWVQHIQNNVSVAAVCEDAFNKKHMSNAIEIAPRA